MGDRQTTIRLPAEIDERLRQLAFSLRRSRNSLMLEALADLLVKKEPKT
jgi:predicted transcriptional regulator